MNDMGAENKVNIAKAVLDFFGNIVLLHHAAAKGDYHVRLCGFIFFERADIAENAILRVFSYGAGIIQNKVGLLNRIGKLIAERAKDTLDFFAVGHVALAAVGMHKCFRRRLQKARGKHNRNKPYIFLLFFKFLFWNGEVFPFVIQSFYPPGELCRAARQRQ